MPASSLDSFKVLTFDVVGTLIDFEKGILDHLRAVSGRSPEELSDARIFASYLKGRELNYERSSEVFADVYRHVAGELGFPNSEPMPTRSSSRSCAGRPSRIRSRP